MYNISFFVSILCLCASSVCLPAMAQQGNYAFLKVSHYCNMPYMMPDYFQEPAWADSLMKAHAVWVKRELKVTKVDYKLREAISYHASKLPEDGQQYDFTQTGYAYFAEIQTTLILGENKKNLPELDKGFFGFYLKVYDQKQRKVLQKSIRIPFHIQPNKDGWGDVWLTASQFKHLYSYALRTLMQGGKVGKEWEFQQKTSEELTQWLQESTKTTLLTEGRGKYTWARGDSTLALSLELQIPHKEGQTYRREATFTYGQDAYKYQLKGLLTEKNPKETFIQFITPQLNLASIQNNEALDLAQAETNKGSWAWIAYQHNGMVKVYEGDALKAVLVRNINTGYDTYLHSYWTVREAKMIARLLMAEVLVRALQKQYEVK